MGQYNPGLAVVLILAPSLLMQAKAQAQAAFESNYQSFSDAQHTRVLDVGSRVDLVLDHSSSAVFRSRNQFLFGRFEMMIRLVPGDSAGTVTAFYLQSREPSTSGSDEIDFEFLGRQSPSDPYILQTNVFAKGSSMREQRIALWFDPTVDFHAYSLLWNRHIVIFSVDGTPIRTYRNLEPFGVEYPNDQAMAIHGSLWDGSTWATVNPTGVLIPVNWNIPNASFSASFEGFAVDSACDATIDVTVCQNGEARSAWDTVYGLTWYEIGLLHSVRDRYVVYDYCTDARRYGVAPAECAMNWYQ